MRVTPAAPVFKAGILTSRQRDCYKEAAQQADPKHRLPLAAPHTAVGSGFCS